MKQAFPVLTLEIIRRGIKKRVMAETIGICSKTLNNKLEGKTAFLWNEVRIIQKKFFPDIPVDALFSDDEDMTSPRKVNNVTLQNVNHAS